MEEQTPSGGPDLAPWLAAVTGEDAARVAADLEIGDRRRAFVVDELIEAGFTGSSLCDFVMRLTGLDERQARALVAAHERRPPAQSVEVPKRDEGLARTEIVFRRLNERLAHVAAGEQPPERLELVCECSDPDCARPLAMPYAEYEWLRQHPWRFTLLPGHEAPAVETVVERHEAYVVIEKHVESHDQVEAADPRG